MKFKQYIKEKIGSLPEKIERTAWMEKEESNGRYNPTELEWKLVNPSTDDDRRNYNMIETIAGKELSAMKRKGVLDYMDDKYRLTKLNGNPISYQVEVQLNRYNPKGLMAELRKYKFKVIK